MLLIYNALPFGTHNAQCSQEAPCTPPAAEDAHDLCIARTLDRFTLGTIKPAQSQPALMGDLKLHALDIREVKAPTPGRKESIIEQDIGVHAA